MSNGIDTTRLAYATALLICVSLVCGCRWNETLARRAAKVSSIGKTQVAAVPVRKKQPLGTFGQIVTRKPQPSERTQQRLRRYVLDDLYQRDPIAVLKILKEQTRRNPTLIDVHSLAELAQIEGDWQIRTGKKSQAAKLYATAVLHSYQFLFDDQLDLYRNAYDPQFRSISDIYNQSLESLVKVLIEEDRFVIGAEMEIEAIDETLQLAISIEGRWQGQEFERFEIANDFEVEGLENEYRTYGLGVPIIAIRKQKEDFTVNEKYYPPNLSLPMTVFMRVVRQQVQLAGGADIKTTRAQIQLIDPLQQTMVNVNGRRAPLQSDISTPMAYYLNDPILNSNVFATLAMLDGEFANDFQGLYMLEPYDPNKIPVVMIHGFWSSPVTWLKIFNDLRATKNIRDQYQFWFVLYPTGQPFWLSAAQIRDDLARARRELDPEGQSLALDQMVLVGHSMGGLVAKMQTIDSGDDFWSLVTDKPFESLQGEPEALEKLRDVFFFEASPGVKRVVTIGTPHQGSNFANNTTRWLSQKAFAMPQLVRSDAEKLMKANPDIFGDSKFRKIRTSVDSMTPGGPFIDVLYNSELANNVFYHNIYGNLSSTSLLGNVRSNKGDGVVSVNSAKAPSADSELEVNAEHTVLHHDPKTILEVRRILLEHLFEIGRLEPSDSYVLPIGYDAPTEDEAIFDR